MSSATVGISDESSLVARLSLEQKVRLLTGADSWVLHGESAVGLRLSLAARHGFLVGGTLVGIAEDE